MAGTQNTGPTVNVRTINIHIQARDITVGSPISNSQKGFWERFKDFLTQSEKLSKLLKSLSALFLMLVAWLQSH